MGIALLLGIAAARADDPAISPDGTPPPPALSVTLEPAFTEESQPSPTVPASLWSRIRQGFRLNDLASPLVKDWEGWYSRRPDYVARMVARSQRYLHYIVEEVEKRGMPTEIALLPMIESAYNPVAYSRSHASGIWQFIPSTGKLYGLEQNWWQDERRDVISATRAALDYLQKLYDMFGAWELALASYNWGEGAVSRAIARNAARGLPGDYLSLDMPAETRNYIPKLQAVKNIVARPEAFGLALADIPNRPYFTPVTTARHIDVKLAAKLADTPHEEFVALNPAHNRPVIRADGNRTLLVPADRAEQFAARLEAHDRPFVSWQPYTLGRADRIDRIAEQHGMTAGELRQVNGISANLKNLVGVTILVPANGSTSANLSPVAFTQTPPQPVAAPAPAARSASATHVVRSGDTLYSIARRYGTTPQQVMAWNALRSGQVSVGQSLTIAVQTQTATAAAGTSVKSGTSAKPSRVAQAKVTPGARKSPVRTAAKTSKPAKPVQVAMNTRGR